MRIGVKTRIEPFYRSAALGNILGRFSRRIPVIEGHEALFEIEYTDLESSEKLLLLPIKPVIVEPHGIEGGMNRWGYEPWLERNYLSMKFTPSVSGYIELRVYFKELEESAEIVDEYGRVQHFRGDIGSDKNIRYYYKAFRVRSMYEVLMVLFTGIVAIFTGIVVIIAILEAVCK